MNETETISVITGASSGIGYAIARALKEEGHRTIITARRKENLEKLAGEKVDILAGDLREHKFQDSLENFVYNRYGKCDYLINNAGTIAAGNIDEIDIEKMSAMIRLNIEATFRLTYKFLKRFKKQGRGHIINISSVLGTKVRAGGGTYAATKFAMEALSDALRLELAGTNIQVSCIQPGLVMTELHHDWEVHPSKSMHINHPLAVEDIVEAVRFIMKQPDHVRIPGLMILPKDHQI